jgi:hypothetical protein
MRRENEIYKYQLKLYKQEFQISGGGSAQSLADLTDTIVPASYIVLPAQKRAGIRKTRLKQRATGSERSAKR